MLISVQVLEDRTANGLLVVTLNRPGALNSLNMSMVDALFDIFRRARRDPEVKAVVLRGEGNAFCAGDSPS
jgi:enoyl-CoA hydratase/carnithine racemase